MPSPRHPPPTTPMTLHRTESFVPLTTLPNSGEQREFRIAIVPRSEQSQPLQSLDQPEPPPSGSGAGKICEPRVFLQCDGDRVTNIRVQCSCGQIMDLACVYEAATKPA